MPDANTLKIIVMGPAGSGKTTQAEFLAKHFNISHLDMGEFMRNIDVLSDVGRMVKAFAEKGTLVPDDVTLKLLDEEIKKPAYKNGFVLNGTPRTLAQAQRLSFEPSSVVYLAVSDEENIKRLQLRGRADDTPELIKQRLKIYHQQTEPILAFYRQMGRLLEIDGERSVEVIAEDIVQKIQGV